MNTVFAMMMLFVFALGVLLLMSWPLSQLGFCQLFGWPNVCPSDIEVVGCHYGSDYVLCGGLRR